MPLVAHNNLPSFVRLKKEGRNVLEEGKALQQDIRELHIGLLNMMPDAALEATERQFLRLIGESNQIAQFYVHPFTLPELERGPEARAHIEQYYESYEQIQRDGLDALIITGANISNPDLTKAKFWAPLQDVMHWACENVTSTICSCLATHAFMQFQHGQKRTPLKKKLWGVYPHRVVDRTHPVVSNMNTLFYAPHSRFNTISRTQFEEAGMRVLVESRKAGVHIAASQDGLRVICFQGHPEYDTVSLLKEYTRELDRFARGEIKKPPPFPAHYFDRKTQKIMRDHLGQIKKAGTPLTLPGTFDPEFLENTWRDSARAVIGNWMGAVYQVTSLDRRKPFMDGVNPEDPLGIRTADSGAKALRHGAG